MIFPKPKFEEYYEEKYTLKNHIKETDLLTLYNFYKGGNEDLKIKTDVTFSKDEYELLVNADGILITASEDCGVFRAITSLKQLLKNSEGTLSFCHIKDKPDFKHRGYLLDISEARMPKLSTLIRYIDLLADLKYNEFQLDMQNFVFKYKAFPKYTEDIECLTPEDIEYLDKYCADRFISLVPNQNSFGHMSYWMAKDELKHLRVGNDEVNTGTLNPLHPESIDFVDKLYDSLLPHFSSEYVNIGFDEAGGLGKYQLEEICKEKGRMAVFNDWLTKVSELIKTKYNKKIQFWADMVVENPEIYKSFPKGAVALNWGYDPIATARMGKQCAELHANNIPYYICPSSSTWLCATGRFDVITFNLRTCAEIGVENGAIGYLVTDWGAADGHNSFPVWNLIPCALAGQYAWNVGKKQNTYMMRMDYKRAAQKYIDENVFGAKISPFIYKYQQYYLLEPERIPGASMSMRIISKPLTETALPGDFDLDVCGEDFYFDNVLEYLYKVNKDFENVSFDENYKRQMMVNVWQVIIGAELCKIRMNRTATSEKIDELINMIDENVKEYRILWDRENFPKGREEFVNQLLARKADLVKMKENGNRVC